MEIVEKEFLDVNVAGDPEYALVVRRFENGRIEATAKPIRPMQEYFRSLKGKGVGGYASASFHEDSEVSALSPEERKQQTWERSVRRAKQRARWLCMQMQCDRLLTLTYRENMQDRERCYADFKRFLRLARAEGLQLHYVAVPEVQQRGAYHVHLAVRGWQKISVIRKCWYKALGGKGDERGSDTPGQVDVTKPRAGAGAGWMRWNSTELAKYIVKYMAKTFSEVAEEKCRYWQSRGIPKPVVDKIWLASADMEATILQSVSLLQTLYGLRGAEWDMWLSPDSCCFWLSGPTE